MPRRKSDRYRRAFLELLEDRALMAALHFDFDAPGSPTAPGYTSVLGTTTYTSALGYGWSNGTIATFNRGGPSPLLRDGNSGTDATFAVDLANGNYFVNVTMGDVNTGASQMGIAAEGNVVVSNMATYSGPFPQAFTHKAFLVTVGDGQLNLRFTGTTPNFFLNALDIVPQGELAPITLSTSGPVAGDAVTRDTVTGTGALPNSLVTISADFGSIVSPDANSSYSGVQVQSNGSGAFSFLIQRPGSAGDANIKALQVNGEAYGTSTRSYTGTVFMVQDGDDDPGFIEAAGFQKPYPANFTKFNGTLYFTARDDSNGGSLWKINTTTGLAEKIPVSTPTGSSGAIPDT